MTETLKVGDKVKVKRSAMERMAKFSGIPLNTFNGVTLIVCDVKKSDGRAYAFVDGKRGSKGGAFSPEDLFKVG